MRNLREEASGLVPEEVHTAFCVLLTAYAGKMISAQVSKTDLVLVLKY
jgi:hypothetical protein